MARLTVRLPETLHRQVAAEAQREGVSLNHYIVYALTRQVTLAYTVQALPEEAVAEQRTWFTTLRERLGRASDAEVERILTEREVVEPEPELFPEVVARLRERLAAKEQPA